MRLFAVTTYAIPVFFLGLLLKLLFAVHLTWFYSSGRASPSCSASNIAWTEESGVLRS